jgi:hypothetical protein
LSSVAPLVIIPSLPPDGLSSPHPANAPTSNKADSSLIMFLLLVAGLISLPCGAVK